MLIVSALLLFLQTSIYSLDIRSSDGSIIHLSRFQGKRILIVNTASQSRYASQYASLEQLYQKYKDSLVIIALPSNDFNNETGNDTEIGFSVNQKYHITYLLASKIAVKGAGVCALYRWLSELSQNGAMESTVAGDFTKYLISSGGQLVAVFSGSVDPMNMQIQNAITNNY